MLRGNGLPTVISTKKGKKGILVPIHIQGHMNFKGKRFIFDFPPENKRVGVRSSARGVTGTG